VEQTMCDRKGCGEPCWMVYWAVFGEESSW
jgi:hypothetical protein